METTPSHQTLAWAIQRSGWLRNRLEVMRQVADWIRWTFALVMASLTAAFFAKYQAGWPFVGETSLIVAFVLMTMTAGVIGRLFLSTTFAVDGFESYLDEIDRLPSGRYRFSRFIVSYRVSSRIRLSRPRWKMVLRRPPTSSSLQSEQLPDPGIIRAQHMSQLQQRDSYRRNGSVRIVGRDLCAGKRPIDEQTKAPIDAQPGFLRQPHRSVLHQASSPSPQPIAGVSDGVTSPCHHAQSQLLLSVFIT